jgi:hypothetical protein
LRTWQGDSEWITKRVKARKFRFGRTEKKLKDQFGVDLLEGLWDDSAVRNPYTMDEQLRVALREGLGTQS